MNLTSAKILIIVPAFNESGNIVRTIADIKKQQLSVDILVIDDGSNDTTVQEASEAGAKVVSLPFNLGIGGAVQTGFQYAFQYDYDIAVQMDGDGQHDGSFLMKLVTPILQNQADIVVGRGHYPNGIPFSFSGITPDQIITDAPKEGLINLAAAYLAMSAQKQ